MDQQDVEVKPARHFLLFHGALWLVIGACLYSTVERLRVHGFDHWIIVRGVVVCIPILVVSWAQGSVLVLRHARRRR